MLVAQVMAKSDEEWGGEKDTEGSTTWRANYACNSSPATWLALSRVTLVLASFRFGLRDGGEGGGVGGGCGRGAAEGGGCGTWNSPKQAKNVERLPAGGVG